MGPTNIMGIIMQPILWVHIPGHLRVKPTSWPSLVYLHDGWEVFAMSDATISGTTDLLRTGIQLVWLSSIPSY